MQRIVVVSIIGIDRFTGGYQAAKQAQERTLLAGPILIWILRAAQFHEFVPELVNWGRQDGVSYLPKMRTQLVAARSVAEALADLATLPDSDPAGTDGAPIPEIAYPRPESLDEMARLLVAHRGDPVRIESVVDTAVGEGELLANGALLPGPHATLAGPSFEEWLTGRPNENTRPRRREPQWLTFGAVRLRDLLRNAAPTDASVFESSSPAGLRVRGLDLRGARKVTPLAAFRGRSMIDVPRYERLWARASWNS